MLDSGSKRIWLVLVCLIASLGLVFSGCNVSETTHASGTQNADGDGDPDGDTEPDPDGDTEPDPDGDTEPDPDGDTEPDPDGDTDPEEVTERSTSIGLQGGAAQTESENYKLQIQLGTESAVQSESPTYKLRSPNKN